MSVRGVVKVADRLGRRSLQRKRHCLEGGAGGDLADFGVFDGAAAEIFDGSLEHGAAEVVAVDVEAGKALENAADGIEEGVNFGEAGGGWGVDEGGAPAIGGDELDEVVFGLRFHAGPEEAAVGASSLPADVMEGGAGTEEFACYGGGERVRVGDFAVFVFGDLRGGDAETEEAGVDGAEGFLNGGIIQKILVDVGAEFGICLHERAAGDGADFVDDGRGKAGVKDGCAGGTCCTEKENFHKGRVCHERRGQVEREPIIRV